MTLKGFRLKISLLLVLALLLITFVGVANKPNKPHLPQVRVGSKEMLRQALDDGLKQIDIHIRFFEWADKNLWTSLPYSAVGCRSACSSEVKVSDITTRETYRKSLEKLLSADLIPKGVNDPHGTDQGIDARIYVEITTYRDEIVYSFAFGDGDVLWVNGAIYEVNDAFVSAVQPFLPNGIADQWTKAILSSWK